MMKLKDAKEAYDQFSGKASDVARSLAFAGIAFIWIFKQNSVTGPKIPDTLLLPAAMLVLTLVCDLLHYAVATLMWSVFHRRCEEKGKDIVDEIEFLAPKWINWPALVFFWFKLIAVGIAYVLLTFYTWHIWFLQ